MGKAMCGHKPTESQKALLAESRYFTERGDYREAIAYLEPLIVRDGPLYNVNTAHISYLHALSKQKPQRSSSHERAPSLSMMKRMNASRALGHIDTLYADTRFPHFFHSSTIAMHRGKALDALGRRDEALEFLNERFTGPDPMAEKIRSNNQAVFFYGDTLRKAGRNEEATEFLRPFAQSGKGKLQVYIHIAYVRALLQMGSVVEARDHLELHNGQTGVLRFSDEAAILYDRCRRQLAPDCSVLACT